MDTLLELLFLLIVGLVRLTVRVVRWVARRGRAATAGANVYRTASGQPTSGGPLQGRPPVGPPRRQSPKRGRAAARATSGTATNGAPSRPSPPPLPVEAYEVDSSAASARSAAVAGPFASGRLLPSARVLGEAIALQDVLLARGGRRLRP